MHTARDRDWDREGEMMGFYITVLHTLYMDRDGEPLFSMMPVPALVPGPRPVHHCVWAIMLDFLRTFNPFGMLLPVNFGRLNLLLQCCFCWHFCSRGCCYWPFCPRRRCCSTARPLSYPARQGRRPRGGTGLRPPRAGSSCSSCGWFSHATFLRETMGDIKGHSHLPNASAKLFTTGLSLFSMIGTSQ